MDIWIQFQTPDDVPAAVGQHLYCRRLHPSPELLRIPEVGADLERKVSGRDEADLAGDRRQHRTRSTGFRETIIA